jgi:predicted TPR repeat methyltransferase
MAQHPRGGRHDWRAALAAFNPAAARAPVSPHAAQLLLARGLNAEAEAALKELLGQVPDHNQALQTLGLLLRRVGRWDEAAKVLARAAWVEAGRFTSPADDRGEVAQFLAAADQGTTSPTEAPAAYVTALFDEFADRFDTQLRETLAYQAPELLRAAVARVVGTALHDLDVLDLGCGTGLAGELFRPVARRLDGVDLSEKMLAVAAARGIYDRLSAGELVAHLGGTDQRYHLVLAADVFVYLGDLVPVFTAARRVLRAGGWLAFTVEAADGGDYHLQPVRRYAHSRDYLTRAAETTGFAVRCLEETSTRVEAQRPVRSFLCVWANPEQAETTAPVAPVS